MEKVHLVVRISDKNDRRTNLIHLTRTGKELEKRARVIANETLREALQDITIKELEVSQEVLRKVFNNTRL
jgi:DNA-binding MarR family transcriptional regulator